MNRSIGPERLATLVNGFHRTPAYRGLHQVLQRLIGSGRIPDGSRLPSERAVAQVLGISRNTVTRAYADLVASGHATARQGAGTYVVARPDRRRVQRHAVQPPAVDPGDDPGIIDLSCAASAAMPGVADAYARALQALPAYLQGDGYLPVGVPALRAALAHMYQQRGLPTTPEQIMVTSGALPATAVVARALSQPGDRILIESPVYPNAIDTLRLGGGRLVSAPLADPLGNTGWDLEGIQATLRQTAPRLAYLIADFQNPTGFLMDDAQRDHYAAVLRASGARAIVDETLQSTALFNQPMPAPFAVHAADAVTIGSASKMFWGGLRVGWIRAPQALLDQLVAARVQIDLGSSVFDQLVLIELLAADTVIASRRALLRQRRDALVRALHEYLPDWRWRVPEGGLSMWAQMPHGSATQLAAHMDAAGVHVIPGPVFSVEGGLDDWIRIPFAQPADRLVQAVQRLAGIWSRLPRGAGPSRGRLHALVA